MQKAFFNDRYQQTDAVIEGRKTMARQIMAGIDFPVNMVMGRVLPDKDGKIYAVANGENIIVKLRYKVGEVVAVAQSYEQIGANPQHYISRPDIDGYQIISMCPGWRNKMFVRAELMPHQIRITGIRCERLQDISDEDCMKEGVVDVTYFKTGGRPYELFALPGHEYEETFNTPRQAFAALIDKVCGRGTWDLNPWVVAYEFELVK
nr:MAG: ASCH domain protein [Bacteriophage sp.]